MEVEEEGMVDKGGKLERGKVESGDGVYKREYGEGVKEGESR